MRDPIEQLKYAQHRKLGIYGFLNKIKFIFLSKQCLTEQFDLRRTTPYNPAYAKTANIAKTELRAKVLPNLATCCKTGSAQLA